MKVRAFRADLHIHTALSPCAEPEMNPGDIIRLCRKYGTEIIAVTDHNSGENARAMLESAEGSGVTVWPGMEVQTKEEVHLVVLADEIAALESWQVFVYRHLPNRPNRPDVLGEQSLFDNQGRVTGVVDRLLLTSVDLSVDEVRLEAVRRGLLCFPAHLDRPSFSFLSNLGLMPPAEDFGLLEVSARPSLREVRSRFPSLEGRSVVVSSDAHRLSDLGPARTRLHLATPTLGEFRAAIAGRDGRKVEPLD